MYKGLSKRAYNLPFLISLLLIIPLVSCDNNIIETNPSDPPEDSDPEIPKKAINPYPPDSGTNLPIGIDLSWEIDGDSSSYTFNLYLGTTSPPPLILSGITGCTCYPGPLEFETTYYWRIDSVIGEETTQGDEWSFTTGYKLIRLTFNEASDWDPSWSPDGTEIVFTSDRLDKYNYDLWVIPVSGGKPELLTDPQNENTYPDWSPDGEMVAFMSTRNGGHDIYKIPAIGGEETRLTDQGRDREPTWSNDATRLAIIRSLPMYVSLFVINADGTGAKMVTRGPGEDPDFFMGGPAWAPDNSYVALYGGYDSFSNIHIINVDDPDDNRSVTGDYSDNWDPCWSPDGEKIAFASNRNGQWDIYVVSKYGGNLTRITTDSGYDRFPDWSPDGNKIAFTSGRSGNSDIWIIDVSWMF